MIADEACWERGCACHDSRGSPGVELVRKREWVGLTGQEKDMIARVSIDVFEAMYRVEAKLKEKNT